MTPQDKQVLERESDVMAWFEKKTRDRFAFYDDYRDQFEAFMPDLLKVIQNAVHWQDGELRTYHQSSKSAFKDALRAEGFNFRDEATYSVEHVVSGQHFFSTGNLVRKSNNASLECAELMDRLRPNNLFVSEMQQCFTGFVGIAERMEKIHRQDYYKYYNITHSQPKDFYCLIEL